MRKPKLAPINYRTKSSYVDVHVIVIFTQVLSLTQGCANQSFGLALE